MLQGKKQITIVVVVAIVFFGIGVKYGQHTLAKKLAALEIAAVEAETETDDAETGVAYEVGPSTDVAGDEIVVYVTGAVQNMGLIILKEGSRLYDALSVVGLLEEADVNRINLARILEDGERIYIPFIGGEMVEEYTGDGIGYGKTGLININTADLDLLTELPGVGETLAQRLINYRKANGSFESLLDLSKVQGFTDKIITDLEGNACAE